MKIRCNMRNISPWKSQFTKNEKKNHRIEKHMSALCKVFILVDDFNLTVLAIFSQCIQATPLDSDSLDNSNSDTPMRFIHSDNVCVCVYDFYFHVFLCGKI